VVVEVDGHCGVPVVAYPAGGPAELCSSGLTGMLVPLTTRGMAGAVAAAS